MPDEPSWPTVDGDEVDHDPPTVQVRRSRPADPPTMRIPLPPKPRPDLARLDPARGGARPDPSRPEQLPTGQLPTGQSPTGQSPTEMLRVDRLQPPRVDAPRTELPVPGPQRSDQQQPPAEQSPAEQSPAEQSPAPAAGAGAGEQAADGAAPAKRRKRPLLIGSLVLVVVLAAGAALAGVRLGWFDTTPTATTRAPAPPAEVTRALRAVGSGGAPPSAPGVAAALSGPASNGVLGTLTGVVVDPVAGTTLWQQAESTPLTPASTIKTLTAAAALLELDHTAQLSTKVVQGDQPGTVVLVGGGDPTLSSMPAGVTTVYPGAATLDDLVAQVKAAGPVTSVQFDTSRYVGGGLAPGVDPTDVPNGYVTPITSLILDGGRGNPQLLDTPRTSTPAEDAARELAERLGASVGGQVTAKADAKVLGEVKSPPVDRLVETMMQNSDNVLAETMAREVALDRGQEPSYAGATKAVRDVLTENGFDLTGVQSLDASGLSVDNRVPAKLLGSLLATAAGSDTGDPRTAKLRPLLTALPVAGGSGTLADRFDDRGAAARGWVRAKTGTLTGVNSLAGVVVDADGRLLVFAFMSLSSQANASVRGALDELAAALRGCGCS